MKTLYSILLLMLISTLAYSQAPEAFNYQAVIRNSAGDILANSQVAVQVSMLQDTETGTAVYVERFNPTTNDYGLIALKLGMGDVQSGTFNTIDWGAHPYYIKIEVDPNNGTAFTSMGTSQLLSVPYALYAASGNQGPDGPPGEKGDQGDVGPEGPPGEITDNSVGSGHIINGTIEEEDISAAVFAGWDKNESDDFSGDYNDLANNPNLSNMISIASPQDGDMAYYSSGNWERLPRGTDGQSLYLDGGLPIWRNAGSTNIQGQFQFVTFKPGTSTPIAFGYISADASIESGTGNFTCTWNGGIGRYEITIAGESYFYRSYTTVVTLAGGSAGDGAVPRTNSVGGDLLITLER